MNIPRIVQSSKLVSTIIPLSIRFLTIHAPGRINQYAGCLRTVLGRIGAMCGGAGALEGAAGFLSDFCGYRDIREKSGTNILNGQGAS